MTGPRPEQGGKHATARGENPGLNYFRDSGQVGLHIVLIGTNNKRTELTPTNQGDLMLLATFDGLLVEVRDPQCVRDGVHCCWIFDHRNNSPTMYEILAFTKADTMTGAVMAAVDKMAGTSAGILLERNVLRTKCEKMLAG
jgi:hypothetical protein